MGRTRKYDYYKVLQGNYGYGWDDLCFYNTNDENCYKELKNDLKAYRENEGGSYRVINRRILKEI